ncbi:MAG: alpha/beta hydrolase [Gammaproteobacteria bacterium]|nr:alpha/beta hydrolase [Gammaproteobacteria bacterium]
MQDPQPKLIFAHGLWMNGLEMTWLRSRLRDRGYSTAQFQYNTVAPKLADNCRRFRQFILSRQGPVTLIGHSLGGVLSLQTLRAFPDLPVEKIICLGSPLVDSAAGRSMQKVAPGRFMMGGLLPQAIFEQPLDEWNSAVPVGVIAGTRGFGPGRVVARLPRPHDGTVAVSETRLPGISDHIEIPYTHTTMLFAPVVVNQCDHFVQHGRFMRDPAAESQSEDESG